MEAAALHSSRATLANVREGSPGPTDQIGMWHNLYDEDLDTLREAFTADKLALMLRETMVRKEADKSDEAEAQRQAADVAAVRKRQRRGGTRRRLDMG